MPSAHCVSTVDGIILAGDRGFCELLQRDQADIVGLSFQAVTDPRDVERSKRMLAVLEDGAAPVRLQKRYIRADGSSIAANLFVTRFSDPDRLVSTLFWRDHGRALPPARLWEAALRIRHVHVARMRLFGEDLSTDPVGSLLIGIYLAEAEGRNVALAEIVEFASLPATTATRWLTLLEKRGLVQMSAGPHQAILLTQEGLRRIEAMLSAVYDVPESILLVADHQQA